MGLFEERMEELTEPYPGCLFASYVYQAGIFDAGTMAVIDRVYLEWRERIGAKLREVARAHPPRVEVDLDDLADLLTVVFEGAFILSKTLKEPAVVARQLAHYRAYVQLLFAP